MPPPDATEPRPASHAQAVIVMLIAVTVLLGVPIGVLRFADRGKAPVDDAATDELIEGQKVYHRVCVGCHEPRGTGRSRAFPSLVGSTWLLDDRDTAIRILLLGIVGPIEAGGRRYDGAMPNFGVTLSDLEIARVLTFTRASWGNHADAITAADVARVRASLAGRTAPWAGGAALLEARGARP